MRHNLTRALHWCLAILIFTPFRPATAAAAEPLPAYPGEAWPTATPADAGLDAKLLEQAREYALTGEGSGVVVRGGKVVLAWGDPKQRYDLKSTTKSFGAIALGLAVADRKVALDDPAARHHPSLGVPPVENQQTGWTEKITLYHLATQTAGFDKRGDYGKLLFAPGTKWRYSDAGPNWLAECLTLAYKRDLNDLMFERVFTPIGVRPDDLVWRKNQYREKTIDGVARREFGSGISANVEAMARVGYLMLRGGRWQDQQILSADYVARCGRPQPDVADLAVDESDADHPGAPAHYGLLWWNNGDGTLAGVPRDAYWSWGLYDSLIVVVPSRDLVVARAGKGWKREKGAGPYKVLEPFLTPIAGAVQQQAGQAAGDVAKPAAAFAPPYPPSPVIGGMELDWSTHKREAQGSDNWQLTWADDDHQYGAWGDGGGFGGTNSAGRASLGIARVEGPADAFRGVNVYGGKDGLVPSTIDGKSWGMVCVGGSLHMWVSPKSPLKQMQKEARLYRSADHGRTWTPADWAFTREDGLTIPTICQFGRDYAGAIDDYVYHYFIHPRDDSEPDLVQVPGTLYLARSPTDKLMDRSAYEFFAGTNARGKPRWTPDVAARKPAFEDPNGVGWCMSAHYNAGLRRFVLLTQHGDSHQAMLGVFDAPTPWGPWTTAVYRNESFGHEVPGGVVPPNAFFWCLPTKWQSADGRASAMVFTGAGRGKNNDSFNVVRGRFLPAAAATPPYPPSPVIRRVEWAPLESVTRQAKESDNWPTTWADDDHQYTAYGDGWGFQRAKGEPKLSLGVARIEGGPTDARGADIPAPTIEGTGDDVRGQKASGILCVDGVLYMLLRNANNSQLAWSADHGRTWERAGWRFDVSFGCPTFLNAGRNYADAQDGYAYVYSFDSDEAYHPAERMVLARVPVGKIRERAAYEFFAGAAEGKPTWSPDVTKRAAVFEHAGRCFRSTVTYAPALKRYLWVQRIPPKGAARPKVTEPNGLAIFDAPNPWGPWTTVYYAEQWDIGPGDTAVLPSKWLSPDGRSAHLIFAGDDSFSVRGLRFEIAEGGERGPGPTPAPGNTR